MTKPKNKKSEDKLDSLIWLFIAILFIWVISIFLISINFSDWNERGTFGDSFGAINSLFSGLAFCGIIYTILLQRKELKLQREELVLTRNELKRTANAQEKTNKFQYEQIRIANIPIFHYETIKSEEKNYLIISNESGNIAFDLDIWYFITVIEDDITKKDFIDSFVYDSSKEHVNNNLIHGKFWAIAERGIYTSFARDSRILIPLEYPIEVHGIDMFIQYRDSLNNNYSLKILFDSTNDERVPYITAEFEPKVLEVTNRVDLTDQDLERESMPEYAKWIFDIYKVSIFTGQIKTIQYSGVESRWSISKIRKK
jgi:hypothetical protein